MRYIYSKRIHQNKQGRKMDGKEARGGEGVEPRRRGRPKGRTAQGEATRDEIYQAALRLIARKGFEAATLLDIADEAGVSPALLYKYFPGKRAVVLALYEDLSVHFAERTAILPKGSWRSRYLFALQASLDVLEPHRSVIAALIPVMLGQGEDAVFAPGTTGSRARVQPVFLAAAREASDAPKPADAAALGMLLYLSHLGVLLLWLLDRSRKQAATQGLLALLTTALPLAALALKLGPVRSLIRNLDGLFRDALFGEAGDPLEQGGAA
jgi:AcrR family transcriptional regulator